jgi:hypothetical protein
MNIPATTGQRRFVGWLIGAGVVLLVSGYITAPQWLALVADLLGH